MFDGSDESDDSHSYDSDWSDECCQTGKNDEGSGNIEVNEGFHNKPNQLNNCENMFECDESYDSSAPYELSDVSESSDSYDSDEASNNGEMSESNELQIIGEQSENDEISEHSEGEDNQFAADCSGKYEDNCESDHSESEPSSPYSADDQQESEESHESSQADDGNQSYRGTYTTELSDDDSFLYYNSEAYNNPSPMYLTECNPPAFLNTRPAGGFATIIRAFSVWAEMEQLEKPPPPAAKEVVENLLSKEVTEKAYQCPVCLGICEVGEILKLLPCAHAFHSECILPWLEKTNTCPLCRNEMPTDNEDYELFKTIEAGRQLRI